MTFTFENDTKTFVQTNFNVNTAAATNAVDSNNSSTSNSSSNNLFPYLLVNIGSGVSIIKVTETGHERISGSNIGGGTFWGLCRLLTGDERLRRDVEVLANADSARVDMLVGDIYTVEITPKLVYRPT